jgi:hypothetical protein
MASILMPQARLSHLPSPPCSVPPLTSLPARAQTEVCLPFSGGHEGLGLGGSSCVHPPPSQGFLGPDGQRLQEGTRAPCPEQGSGTCWQSAHRWGRVVPICVRIKLRLELPCQ